MSRKEAEQPIVRVTSLTIAHSEAGNGKKRGNGTTHFTVHGVDAQGAERVYVEHTTEEEHLAWWNNDPLWKEAQTALIRRLLDNPGTRDAVLQVNIAAAIKDGDVEMAAELATCFSPQAWHRLVG
jgi:hypothetical protein